MKPQPKKSGAQQLTVLEQRVVLHLLKMAYPQSSQSIAISLSADRAEIRAIMASLCVREIINTRKGDNSVLEYAVNKSSEIVKNILSAVPVITETKAKQFPGNRTDADVKMREPERSSIGVNENTTSTDKTEIVKHQAEGGFDAENQIQTGSAPVNEEPVGVSYVWAAKTSDDRLFEDAGDAISHENNLTLDRTMDCFLTEQGLPELTFRLHKPLLKKWEAFKRQNKIVIL